MPTNTMTSPEAKALLSSNKGPSLGDWTSQRMEYEDDEHEKVRLSLSFTFFFFNFLFEGGLDSGQGAFRAARVAAVSVETSGTQAEDAEFRGTKSISRVLSLLPTPALLPLATFHSSCLYSSPSLAPIRHWAPWDGYRASLHNFMGLSTLIP